MVKKLPQYCWSMWPNHESVVDVSEPFSGIVVCCIQCYFLKGKGKKGKAIPVTGREGP
jgi:hypothetical protein